MSGTVYQLYPGSDAATEKPPSTDQEPLADAPTTSHDSTMSDDRIAHIERGISKLEGFIDGFRSVPQLAITTLSVVLGAVALVLTVGIFVLSNMNSQIHDVGAKVDAIPKQLTEEFRAMRAETSAQTSAIANSITAARQFQPQIAVMPTPQQAMPANGQNPEPLANQKFELRKQMPPIWDLPEKP
jgi:hypothetical protein